MARNPLGSLVLLVALAMAAPVCGQSGDGTGDAPAAAEIERVPDAVEEQPGRSIDLSGPQATMRSFLVAIQDADGDRPERIDDAVACLDISQIEGDDGMERARSLARRLRTEIDRIGVKLDDIPVDMDGDAYTFHELGKDDVDDEGEFPAIRMARAGEDGQWRFTASTLAAIPALESKSVPGDEESKPVASDVPAGRRTPRATMGTFLDAMNADPPDVEAALLCLDPTGQDPEAWGVRGRTLATKLKNVMDKIKLVVLADIPGAADGGAYAWFTGETGNVVIGPIADVSTDLKADWRFTPKPGEWRFTSQTLGTIDAIYKEYEDRPIIRELRDVGRTEELTLGLRFDRWMPSWSREQYLYLQGWQWVALGALVPVGWVIKGVVAGVATLFLGVWLRRRRIDIEPAKRRGAVSSFGWVAAVLFWYLIVHQMDLPAGLLGVLLRFTQLAIVVTAVWAAYRLVDILGGYITSNKDFRLTEIDEVLIPLLSKILRVFVVIAVLLFVLQWAGYKATTVLGALGVGGVALAFAAQDTLGNFFGSITVLFDRPFGIADWIVIGDIEGTVERVGFRSTRVRTFYNSMVTIPNSQMVNTNVDNYGARTFRRVRVMISITYATPAEKIDAFCEGIRELIRLHPYTRKDYYHVYFNKFEASSLDILLYAFFEVPDWGTELRERHRLFVDIKRLADRLGVDFAFPTQTVWLERGGPDTTPPSRIDGKKADQVGVAEAAQLFDEAYGTDGGRLPPVVIDSAPRSRRGTEISE